MTTQPTRGVAIIGRNGKMGRALAGLAPERGWRVVAEIDEAHNAAGKGITRLSLGGADVAIDFTAPEAAEPNIRACVAAECPIVVGTTGWYDALPAVAKWVEEQGG